MFNITRKKIWQKWSLAFKIMPLIIVLGILKFLAHHFGYDVLELNALFTSLVAGTIFLIGFLISGVLADYKESEKLPSELTATLKTLFDDAYTILKGKDTDTSRRFIDFQKSFLNALMDWFYSRETTASLLNRVGQMNDFFVTFEQEGVQANYIIKMKNDQNSLRKMILRIATIRDTDFVGSAYAIVEAMGVLIAFGMVIIKIEPFFASLFFTMLVTFLIFYMFLLVRDLDNPFDYSVNGEQGTEVPLTPLHDLEKVFLEFQYN